MYDAPILMKYEDAARGLWGGGSSGFTVDWVYFLSDDVCQIVFVLPVGGFFTQIEDSFEVYERDTLWRVLAGVLVAANPVTGEVHRLAPGDSLAFRGDVWHHGFATGPDPVMVIEFTSPPPTRPERLIERKPLPEQPRYGNVSAAVSSTSTARVLRSGERRWALEGLEAPVLVGEILSTPALTVYELDLRPGQRTDRMVRSGAQTLYVLEGRIGIEVVEARAWIEAGPRDGVFIPPSTPYRLLNSGAEAAFVLCQLIG